jgi:hypothetical protein
MHSVLESSRITAAVAIRILNGEKAGDIKTVPTGFAAPVFDWRQMQRWGISESNLPPGSTVYFGSQQHGRGTRGRSRSSARSF